MKCKLYYSDQALKDLDAIWNYIFVELGSLDAAEKTIRKILEKAERLCDFPQMGTSLSTIIGMQNEYRFIVSGHYMGFYRYIDHKIYVDRVLYSRRDYMRILFENLEDQKKD